MVGTVLGSRFPMLLWWGEDLIQIYNDAYRPILGEKHPKSLGAPGSAVWREIWHILGPQADQVLHGGVPTWNEHLLLPMRRRGFLEETYFTFSYSPAPRDDGQVGGVLVTCQETTSEVVNERRMDALRELTAQTTEAATAREVCQISAKILSSRPADIPFGALYLLHEDGDVATLASAIGIDQAGIAALEVRLSGGDGELSAAFRRGRQLGEPVEISVGSLVSRLPSLSEAPVATEPRRAVVVPLARRGQEQCYGFLACAISSARVWNDSYAGYFQLAADYVAAAIGRARACRQERERSATLVEVDRAKTAFFSNVSHEFRTPLTLILGPIEDALRRPQEALAPDDLKLIHRSALRLMRLVNSLLDFARAESGRLEARFVPTDLCRLVSDAASHFHSAFEGAGIEFSVECDEILEPAWVAPDAMERVLFNLLSNAFKHTFAGEVRCEVTRGDDEFILRIRDSGVGIASSELPQIFDRFHRVEGAQTRSHEGAGMGLALVNDAVELHGGKIAVESTVEVGTTFTIRIPAGNAHLPADRLGIEEDESIGAVDPRPFVEEALLWRPSTESPRVIRPTAQTQNEHADGNRPRILLADDNADMRAYLTRILAERWSVEGVVNGRDALNVAQETRPDLIVTDLTMPGLDGIELLESLRSEASTRDIPVVLISAQAGEETRIEALEQGANDYLVKPFTSRELVARVGAQLELSRTREQLAEVAKTATQASRAKEEFLAMLGHELRNPLAPIVTALQLLKMRGESSREYEVIERQVQHLVRLVDDLLDVSRIARGQVELNKRNVEAAEIVRRAVEQVDPVLERGKHNLTVDVADRGLSVYVDPARMTQVLTNLLTNAARYSSDGSRIVIRAQAADGVVRFHVIDEGIGIEPALLEQIFDRFTQETQQLARTEGGLGLGLAIVRNLVELHDGSVDAHSEGTGKGSEFVVEIPALVTVEQATENMGLFHSDSEASSIRILVVDDNRDAAEMLAAGLEEQGHGVEVAHDGPAALRLVGSTEFDVGLIDLGLPVMDGYEVAARIADSFPDMTLVAVTGYGQQADRDRTKRAGFAAHLVKPVSLEVVENLLETLEALAAPDRTLRERSENQ